MGRFVQCFALGLIFFFFFVLCLRQEVFLDTVSFLGDTQNRMFCFD